MLYKHSAPETDSSHLCGFGFEVRDPGVFLQVPPAEDGGGGKGRRRSTAFSSEVDIRVLSGDELKVTYDCSPPAPSGLACGSTVAKQSQNHKGQAYTARGRWVSGLDPGDITC